MRPVYAFRRQIQPVSSALILFSVTALVSSSGLGAQEMLRPNLADIASGDGWTLANRSAVVEAQGDRAIITFDARQGSGAAWLNDVEFDTGTIELLIRGKNNPGRSFVGVAFRGVDEDTYDAIYFRPFNFVGDNDLSRSHMVQYVSHPEHPWSQLRQDHPGVYENSLLNPPDPDDFFRARIVVTDREIRVYVNDDAEPSLAVTQLTNRRGGRIGLWMGNGSDGSFADLVLTLEPLAGRP